MRCARVARRWFLNDRICDMMIPMHLLRLARLAIALSAAGVFLAIGSAMAASLNAEQAKRFVAAMPDVSALSDDMRKGGRDKKIEDTIRAVQSKDGEFSPLLKGMPIMKKEFPADYERLSGIVEKHGFSSAEDWAAVGDRVMTTYMAIKADGENTGQLLSIIENMTPEQFAALPPEAQNQFAHARMVIKATAAVSPAEMEMVRPLVPVIEADMKNAAARAGMNPP